MLEIKFKNCVFNGFHHAITVTGDNNVSLDIKESIFKN